MGRLVRIGAGAGYAGDRIEPAQDLAERGNLDYLCFECLAERTIALAQAERRRDSAAGFDRRLIDRLRAVLPACSRNGTRIITNMGAANPAGAARVAAGVAADLGLEHLRIAAVVGDDILDRLIGPDGTFTDAVPLPASFPDATRIVSANVYTGIEGIIAALRGGADVVITGRVSDPALFVAPLVHEFGWALDDWHRLGQATFVGHLLECAGQLTGGYFADPGLKDVHDLSQLGFPLAEVDEDGSATFTKLPGTGGSLSVQTCKEQLLYEVLDPGAYVQPHVTADCRGALFEPLGPDRIRMAGATGRARPDMLKVSVGYLDGYIGEGQMSYAGPGALARARMALEIVADRLARSGIDLKEVRYDIIGADAVDTRGLEAAAEPIEPRIRVAARVGSQAEAQAIGDEVETLYTNGPAGGGGCTKSWREVIAVTPLMVPRSLVSQQIIYETAHALA